MTPYELKILLHYYCCVGSYFSDNPETDLAHEIIDNFCKAGVLEDTLQRTEITELGRAWVENILITPLPIAKYVDPRVIAVHEGKP